MTPNTGNDDTPNIAGLLDTLGDSDCRMIIEELTEPMTAIEIAEACDMSSSTVYRKLSTLQEASLLRELTEVKPDGHHTTRYEVSFETLHLELDENHALAASAERPEQTADEHLSEMWTEIRKER